MPPDTRSAAGLIQNDDSMRDPDDEDHLPNSAFAIMNARPEPQMEEPPRVPGVPELAYTLPQELYMKAQNQQNELTDAERQLLLSRGDLIGKALAQPSSLTEVERYKVMGRPPPDVVSARIKLASNGELSTIAELVVKATPDASGLNDAELYLMANHFHEETLHVRFMRGDYDRTPGASQAYLVWCFCEELGLVEEEKVMGAARLKQFLKDQEKKYAPHVAAMAAKEALANTPEALQLKAKVRALKKEEQDNMKENHALIGELNELYLKVELESDLGDLEKDELRRRMKVLSAQNHVVFLKSRAIRDRIYRLGPPNPHKELGEDFARKQQVIVERLVNLSKQLEGLQGQGNGSEEDEVKGKIEDSYAEWAVITQKYDIAKGRLFGKTASDDRLFREDEVEKEQIALERKVIMARILELQGIEREMGEDDTGKKELKQQIEDRYVPYRALGERSKVLREKSRQVEVLRLRRLGIEFPYPEPHQRDASEELYIQEQRMKAQEENPEVSEQGVEKMLEDRWQAMKPEEHEPYRHQVHINWLKGFKARPRPTPVWEDFD